MSEVQDASAAPSPAIESRPESTAPLFDMDSMSKEQRQKLMAKGQLPKRIEKPAKPADPPPAPSEAPKAKTESDSDPEDEESRKTNREWRKTTLRAKDARIAQLEEQLAAKPNSATATPEVKPPDSEIPSGMRDFPDPENFNTLKEWRTDCIKWQKELIAEVRNEIRSEISKEKTAQQIVESGKSVNLRIEAAKAKYTDFSEIADTVAISCAALSVLEARPDGMDLLYALGLPKNAEAANRIAKLPDIKGLDWTSFKAALKEPKNAAQAGQIMRAIGQAEAEIDRFSERLATPPPDEPAPKPAPKTLTSAPTPARPAGGGSTAQADPLAAAIRNKDWTKMNQIMNERARIHARA